MKRSLLLPIVLLIIYVKAYTQGKVGINTATPLALLHVNDSSVLFSGPPIVTSPFSDPPTSGAGIRMMWYPVKAAFRVGYVNDDSWDKNNIGTYSFGSGHSSLASGSFSTAMGLLTVASGTSSVSLGSGTQALANNSVAMGTSARAEFSNSISIGTTTRSAGQYSTAMGAFTVSHAYNCFTVGRYNDSVSTGFLPTFQWQDTDPLFIIGNGSGSGSRSNAITVLKNAKTGINTSAPKAMLHVKDSSVLFSGAADVDPTPGNLPDSSLGVRMLWYPDKAAFRAGRSSSTSWKRDSIGNYSFAAGYQTKAKGISSVAFGENSQALGSNSFAVGEDAMAVGNFSAVLGFDNTALGQQSFAMGYSTIASGDGAVTFGNDSEAEGDNAMAIGYSCRASGIASFSFGDLCRATGGFSFAGGRSSRANGESSVALGEDCLANGSRSVSMGYSTYAPGNCATALGAHGSAVGDTSTVIGNGSAIGNYSTSIGKTTRSKSYNSFVVGRFNDTTSSSSTAWIQTDPLFIVGNGISGDLSNAFTVLKNAKTGINITQPLAGLHIKGFDATDNRHLRLEDDNTTDFGNIYYNGDLVIKNNRNGGDFFFKDHLNNNAMSLFSTGNMTIAGTLTQNSDARLKKNIVPINGSLEKILRITGYNYLWIGKEQDPSMQAGLLAQEVEKVMPELVRTDGNGIKSVNYIGVVPYLIEAIKEQQKKIESLENQLNEIRKLLQQK